MSFNFVTSKEKNSWGDPVHSACSTEDLAGKTQLIWKSVFKSLSDQKLLTYSKM